MSEWHTATCENCGWSGHIVHPVNGAKLLAEYRGNMLCSTCRVDVRLDDNDF